MQKKDKFVSIMSKFQNDATESYQESKQVYTNGLSKFTELVGFFAEDTKKTTTDDFFGIMKNFIIEYKKVCVYVYKVTS